MKRVKHHLESFVGFSFSSQIPFILFAEIVVGFFTVIVSLVLFLKIGREVLGKEIFPIDTLITHTIYSLRSPEMTIFMNFITFLASNIFLTSAIIFTILFLLTKNKKDAFVFAFILISGVGLNQALKDTFQRARPTFLPLATEQSYSFPSGHTMNGFIFYTCLSYFIFRRFKNKKLGYFLIVCSAILVLLIGVSRVYLGVHFPTDVIAGYLGGILWFVIVLLFEKTVVFFKLFRKYESNKKY